MIKPTRSIYQSRQEIKSCHRSMEWGPSHRCDMNVGEKR